MSFIGDNVVLSKDTIEEINNCFNGQTNPTIINNIQELMIMRKKQFLINELKKVETKLSKVEEESVS